MPKSDDPASYPAEPPRNPIVLGVVGHVDPRREDLTALKAAFEEILADFRERYPSTPLVVMSSLARGTDQLAAGVALDRKEPVARGRASAVPGGGLCAELLVPG